MTGRQQHGLVISDLHLFAQRSRAAACLKALEPELKTATVVVLNGDIFDFRWSTLASEEATLERALEWLRAMMNRFPRCQFHFILGNHDCLVVFKDRLSHLARERHPFHWHEHSLRLGASLFLHGDCAQQVMDGPALWRYREGWSKASRRGKFALGAYRCSDQIGLTRLAHVWKFPRPATVARVRYHLDRTQPDWRKKTRHCYFGHTHLAFSNHASEGVLFHNTGSAIRGTIFNPLRFAIAEVDWDAVAPTVQTKG